MNSYCHHIIKAGIGVVFYKYTIIYIIDASNFHRGTVTPIEGEGDVVVPSFLCMLMCTLVLANPIDGYPAV